MRINVTSIELAKQIIEFPVETKVSKKRQNDKSFKRIRLEELPEAFVEQNKEELEKAEGVFCDFKGISDVKKRKCPINLINAPVLSMHYARFLLEQHFESDPAFIVDSDFVEDVVVYVKYKDTKPEYVPFGKFKLKVTHGRITDGLELGICFDGETYCSTQNCGELYKHESTFNRIVYKNRIYHYDDEGAPFHTDLDNAYPILNKALASALGINLPGPKSENKYTRIVPLIEGFLNKFILKSGLTNIFKFPGGEKFYELPSKMVKSLPSEAAEMIFKNGKTSSDPITGFKGYGYGPYSKGPQKVKLLYIYQANLGNDSKAKIEAILKEGLPYQNSRGYNKKIPAMHTAIYHGISSSEDITFTSLETATEEVKTKLSSSITFQEGYTYLAIYISPISKTDFDDKNYNTVYGRLKEICLEKNIVLQGIAEKNINGSIESLDYSFTNIYSAILAKIGGIPWTIKPIKEDDMIIGIGAFNSQKKGKRYVAGAFRFDSYGNMQEYDCLRENDTDRLAAKIYDAIDRFAQCNDGVIPQRIIIHSYRRISKKAWMPIEKMLGNLGLQIPVIVININKNTSDDIFGYDTICQDKMPLAGTHIKINTDTYLLYNNGKYEHTKEWEKKLGKNYHFPIKLRFDFRNCPSLNTEATITELIQQIFQLSRLDWRTTDIQNLPITILYPSLVAEFLPYFSNETLPNKAFSTKALWFL